MGACIVTAYLGAGMTRDFPARDRDHGREIANRIITEGLWVTNGDEDTFYPPSKLYKVSVKPCPNLSTAPTETPSSPASR
jgi:hypothetical protein